MANKEEALCGKCESFRRFPDGTGECLRFQPLGVGGPNSELLLITHQTIRPSDALSKNPFIESFLPTVASQLKSEKCFTPLKSSPLETCFVEDLTTILKPKFLADLTEIIKNS